MKIVYFITAIYLGVLGVAALFLELNKLNWFWKLALGLLAFVSIVLTLAYQHIEKKIDEWEKQKAEMRSEYQTQVLNKKLDDLKEKEKKGIFSETDYLNRISLELEQLNLNMRINEKILKRQYLTMYFDEAGKIPNFYTWEEWKETESVLFRRISQALDGFFNNRGMFDSSIKKAIDEEFKKERDKYIKAKERQYNSKKD